jgi:hypothetical protein
MAWQEVSNFGSDGSFPETINDPATGKFLLRRGRHRTSAMGASTVFSFDWDYDQAYKEMKQYDFYTRFGHRPSKISRITPDPRKQESLRRPNSEQTLRFPAFGR